MTSYFDGNLKSLCMTYSYACTSSLCTLLFSILRNPFQMHPMKMLYHIQLNRIHASSVKARFLSHRYKVFSTRPPTNQWTLLTNFTILKPHKALQLQIDLFNCQFTLTADRRCSPLLNSFPAQTQGHSRSFHSPQDCSTQRTCLQFD